GWSRKPPIFCITCSLSSKPAARRSPTSRPHWKSARRRPGIRKRPRALKSGSPMEQRTEQVLSPHRIFSRADWAKLRQDTPMTLSSEEVARLRSLHDRLDMEEVEEIYLPLSRLLSIYVAATQRLFRAQQGFLGTEDVKMPYI